MSTPPSENKTMKTIIIVVVILLALCICLPVCVIVILALLGPSIGNVFSNIVDNVGLVSPLLPII
jgi:hypothetical protein